MTGEKTVEFLTHPAFLAAAISAFTVAATKFIDFHISRRKRDRELDVSGRELLSKDEREFRESIIKQLQDCHNSNRRMAEENVILQKKNIDLEVKLSLIQIRVTELERLGGAK